MDIFFRPLIEEVPDKPEGKYRWTDILCLVVMLFYVFWKAHHEDSTSWLLTGYFLSFGIPDTLCGKFQTNQKPAKSVQSIIGMSKSSMVICWSVAIAVLILAILAGLGVSPVCEILGAWPDPFFHSIPLWLASLAWIVFLPVFRVATFIEKRVWLCWAWASAASVIAFAILYFQHRMA
jgi:hypothetical protein